MADFRSSIGKLTKYKYPILLLLVGLILLMMPSCSSKADSHAAGDDELRFEQVLTNAKGVGEASVIISDSGVVVVCDGADDSGVKLSILKATEVFTGFSSDRIEILKTAD